VNQGEQEAKRIFLRVIERPLHERRSFLEETCDDDELRREVESLLAHAGSFTSDVAASVAYAAAGVEEEGLPADLGAIEGYRIRRRIAEGAMGCVYEAEQTSPRRTVALKVLRPGAWSARSLRRFELEAELLGRLRHPGIAQIYQAGTFELRGDRLPYFAMEFVPQARNVIEFAHERGLDLAGLIDLIVQVCDAVNHAHQNGVIHRDLKPANVLVDPEGRAKVIDFGVARASDLHVASATLRTSAGQIVGTLQYMSPEQCGGDPRDLDVRADVYAIGVMLYEMACGRLPYEVNGLALGSAVRVIEEAQPVRPRAVNRRLPRDVEAIALKALEKDRNRRYGSAADLARDLRSWADGEPIEARPLGAWSRLGRWIGRHPVVTTAAACVAIAVAALGGGAYVLNRLGRRPDRVEVGRPPTTVTMVSPLDHRLYTWKAQRDSTFFEADLLERPEGLGGGKVVLVAERTEPSSQRQFGEVRLYEAGAPATPYWTSLRHAREPRPFAKAPSESHLFPLFVRAGDILPGMPGLEVLLVEQLDPYSPCAIRILDLAGTIHYEVWHDGTLGNPLFLESEGLLVVNGWSSESLWSERGVSNPHHKNPAVVFAVEPRAGHLARTHSVVEGGRRHDETLRWYKWVGDLEALHLLPTLSVGVVRPTGRWSDGRHAMLNLSSRLERDSPWNVGEAVVLNARGEEVRRMTDDATRDAQLAGRLPKGPLFRLLEYEELPPVLAAELR
jgi:hypothetical protein